MRTVTDYSQLHISLSFSSFFRVLLSPRASVEGWSGANMDDHCIPMGSDVLYPGMIAVVKIVQKKRTS